MQDLGFHRRAFLTGAGAALGALLLEGRVRMAFGDAEAPVPRREGATLDHLIVLWMAGGPSHLDTFDPKPGRKTAGALGAIPTAVDGLSFSEPLPLLAKEASALAVVRGLTSGEGAHERATRLLQTAYPPSATLEHPHVGAWLARALADPACDLPAFVAFGPSTGSGFLGGRTAPFEVTNPSRPLADLAPPVGAARQRRREALLDALGHALPDAGDAPVAEAWRSARARARRLLASPAVLAFDASKETEASRAAYGKTPFGTACLLARRLVEAGVTVVHVSLGGWDLHQHAYPATANLLKQVDPAFASLLRDLRERSLLDRTLVLWMGEFGRTPDLNATSGRDHHPHAFSAVLAGGGIPGGTVVGRTDEDGRKVVQDPVPPPALLATAIALAGLDPHERVFTQSGRPTWPVPKEAPPVEALLPGPLKTPRAAG